MQQFDALGNEGLHSPGPRRLEILAAAAAFTGPSRPSAEEELASYDPFGHIVNVLQDELAAKQG